MTKHPLLTTLIFLFTLSLISHPIDAQEISPRPDVTETDGRMGTCFSYYDEGTRAPQATAAGSRWDRFDFRWDSIQPAPGTFDARGHHNIVNNIDLPNQLDVVGILWATPGWAACSTVASQQDIQQFAATLPAGYPGRTRVQADPGSRIPCNLNTAWDDTNNYWGQYVYRTVTEFKDTVHVWELWNEADRPWFWAGNVAEYAQILKIGYQAIKAADPEATVLFGGLAYWGNVDFHNNVLDHLLSTDPDIHTHNGYFDVMSLHLYSNVYHNYDISHQIMQDVQSRVGWHPLWLTEVGVPIWDETPSAQNYEATAEQAANYVIQGYAEARAVGVDKFFFFRLHDEGMDQVFGLTRNDHTLRPSYVAYQVAARYLRDENQITGPFRGNVERITYLGTPYGRIDVVWNASSTSLTTTLPAILPTATLVDKRGVTQTLTATHQTYTLPLAAATSNTHHPDDLYMIGGDPLLLIQSDPHTPTSKLRPIPVGWYTNTLTLTWDVTPTLSGYWYAEIQRSSTPTGPWELVAGWEQTNAVTQTTLPLPYDPSNYQPGYFRARVRNHVGNWEPWPAIAETHNNFGFTRTVILTATLTSERPNTVLLPYPEAELAWHTPDNTIVSHTIGNFTIISPAHTLAYGAPWIITATVEVGLHHLHITQTNHFPATVPFWVLPGEGAHGINLTHKLKIIRNHIYLPLILRNHQDT